MSQENVEVVRRWIEFYNGRDTDGLMQLTTSDYEMKSVFADVESGGIFRGYAGFPFEYFKTLDDAYDQFQLVVQDFIDVGAAVLMVAHIEWRGRASGAEGQAARKGAGFIAVHDQTPVLCGILPERCLRRTWRSSSD